MSLMVPMCDKCNEIATAIIPHKEWDECYCEYHWQAKLRRLPVKRK